MEMRKMKNRRNITFLKSRKIKESYMKVYISANVAQKVTLISNIQPDKYRTLIEKLVQLGPND